MSDKQKYAIIKTGGNKQLSVKVGDIIEVDLFESNPGDEIEFAEVLFATDGSNPKLGQPSISNFLVYGKVLGQVKGNKINSLKYKPSHNQCRQWGHRQKYIQVEITEMGSPRKSKEK